MMDSQRSDEDLSKVVKNPGPPRKRPFYLSISFVLTVCILAFVGYRLLSEAGPKVKEIPYSQFKRNLGQGQVDNVLVDETSISGKLHDGTSITTLRVEDPDLTQLLEWRQPRPTSA